MDYEQIEYERRGPVAVITIRRPERMNAIGARAHRELVDAWGRFRDDETALVGILTGAGDRAFCAGGDLKSLEDGEPVGPRNAEEVEAHNRGEADGILGPSRWTDIHKPTIAAVNGVAYAGGSSGSAGATWRSPTRTPPSASPAGAGTSASPTGGPSAYPGSSVGGARWS